MRLVAVAFATVMAVAMFAALMTASGCTVHNDKLGDLSFMQLPAGEDVQTITDTVTGLDVSPMGSEGPSLRLGIIRRTVTRVPGYDPGTYIPDVYMSHDLDAESGAVIGDTLEVGVRERK